MSAPKASAWEPNDAVPDCWNRDYYAADATCFVRLHDGAWCWELWCVLTCNRGAHGEAPSKEAAQRECDEAAWLWTGNDLPMGEWDVTTCETWAELTKGREG